MPTPLKIVIVNHTGIVSGAEKVLLLILDNLDATKFAITVCCPRDSELWSTVMTRNVALCGLPVVVARFTSNPFRLMGYLRSYLDAIREFRNSPVLASADLIHANSVRAGLLTSLATGGKTVPVVWHVHDILKPHPISTAVRLVAYFWRPYKVVAVSQATAKRFAGWLLRFASQRVPLLVIQNPVDTARFGPLPFERERVRAELKIRSDQFAFAIVGQLTPRKGQLETIRALKELVKSVPGALLLIVGSAVFEHDLGYAQDLKREVADSGLLENVRFLGQRSDMNAVLAATDAVVINSKHEPFSLLALEALAAGKPVVAAAVDGLPELIQEGETGLLVPAGKMAALILAMKRLATDPELCRKLALQGRPYVAKQFTCARFIQRFEDLYLEAAARAPLVSSPEAVGGSEIKSAP